MVRRTHKLILYYDGVVTDYRSCNGAAVRSSNANLQVYFGQLGLPSAGDHRKCTTLPEH